MNNNKRLLVVAPPTAGKTFSLRNLDKLGKAVAVINFDGKPMPFKWRAV